VAASVVVACAKAETNVLKPYQLAEGTRFQDVVTIGADTSGTAPVVTHVKTFRLDGKKGAEVVADGVGSGPSLGTVATGAAIAGITGGVAGGLLIANATRRSSSEKSNVDKCDLAVNASLPECIGAFCLCRLSGRNGASS
jgi:hypothetical protein